MPSTQGVIDRNRTNVHAKRINLLQRGLRQLSRWAPGVAERLALRMFMTPSGRFRRAAPTVDGVPCRQVTLASSGARLVVWEWGTGPAVLLVHGWSGQASQWSPFAAALLQAGYRVIAPDMPAHGYSSGRRATLPDFVRAVRTVAYHAGPIQAIVGHSLGATAATLALAAGVGVQRVVLIAPPTHVPYFLQRLAGWMGLPEARMASLIQRLTRKAGVALDTLDLRQVAPLLETPALILHSRGDREVPFTHGEDVALAWPGAQLIALNGNSHTQVLQNPDVITAAVAFVGEASARSVRQQPTQPQRLAQPPQYMKVKTKATSNSFFLW